MAFRGVDLAHSWQLACRCRWPSNCCWQPGDPGQPGLRAWRWQRCWRRSKRCAGAPVCRASASACWPTMCCPFAWEIWCAWACCASRRWQRCARPRHGGGRAHPGSAHAGLPARNLCAIWREWIGRSCSSPATGAAGRGGVVAGAGGRLLAAAVVAAHDCLHRHVG